MKHNLRWVVAPATVLTLAALACNASGSGVSNTDPQFLTAATIATQPATEAVVAPFVTQPPAADPTAACPKATADTQAFASQENGFCFLVPATMKGGPGEFAHPGDSAGFYGPPSDPNSMEPITASITVTINAPAEDLDSAAYAKKWIEVNYGAAVGLDMKVANATVGGLPATVVSNIPGIARQQTAFVVANGYRYTITASPQPGDFAVVDDQVNAAWKTVTDSIVFFTPSAPRTVVTPDSACPKPTSDTAVHVGELDGVCFLVPTTFSRMADFANGYQGPDVLGDIFGRPLHAELVIAYAGSSEGKTPRQLWEPHLVNQEVSKIDVAGAQDTTLNGFPAIVWTEGKPLASRQAIIVANDHMFTIVNQPYNDPDYKGGEADVELVWQTVTQSLAFFTPFR